MIAMNRPECDGATHDGARTCPKYAVWQVKQTGDREYVYGACGQHLNQVGATLLDGECGELDIRRIAIDER